MATFRTRLAALATLLSIGVGPAWAAPDATGTASPEVLTLRLRMSNVHLLKTATPVLVDAGGPGDMPALVEALAPHGLKVEDIALVVLTHGHSDHAGLGAAIQRLGRAKVAAGAGDVPMLQRGDHGELTPTNLTARLLARFAVDPRFPPFEPDLVVRSELDLAPWGVAGKAIVLPGHTPGSMAVVLDGERAIVGDMLLGGYLGGAVRPDRAGRHYFHADEPRNDRNIEALLQRGVRTFHLGHGGPVGRDSVIEAFPHAAPSTRDAAGGR
ncbi:MAG: MBL fold metallo-hydrolase [Burkholderiales bacterium]